LNRTNHIRRGGRIPTRRSARGERRGATPDRRCGVAKLGTDGPARRSRSVSRDVMDRATAKSSPQTAAGHDRMTRPSRRSSSQRAACGFWIRAWGQREPALRGTGRLNRSAQGLEWLKGGLDIPATRRMRLTLTGTSAPDVDALFLFTHVISHKYQITSQR
jgi:hypothetical protein